MKNASRQVVWSMRKPPTTGPKALVMAVNPDQVPMARPRRS